MNGFGIAIIIFVVIAVAAAVVVVYFITRKDSSNAKSNSVGDEDEDEDEDEGEEDDIDPCSSNDLPNTLTLNIEGGEDLKTELKNKLKEIGVCIEVNGKSKFIVLPSDSLTGNEGGETWNLKLNYVTTPYNNILNVIKQVQEKNTDQDSIIYITQGPPPEVGDDHVLYTSPAEVEAIDPCNSSNDLTDKLTLNIKSSEDLKTELKNKLNEIGVCIELNEKSKFIVLPSDSLTGHEDGETWNLKLNYLETPYISILNVIKQVQEKNTDKFSIIYITHGPPPAVGDEPISYYTTPSEETIVKEIEAKANKIITWQKKIDEEKQKIAQQAALDKLKKDNSPGGILYKALNTIGINP